MSKINRYGDKEKNHINVPWIELFARELEARNHGIDYLQQLFETRKTYGSIEEKMKDIKERIGFDLINKVSEELDGGEVITASDNFDGEEKTASYEHSKEDIDAMSNILGYISDMANSEPHLDSATIVSRCKEEDGLRFGDLRINMSKLKDYIAEKLKELSESEDEGMVVYVKQEPINSTEADDDIAEYYRSSEK